MYIALMPDSTQITIDDFLGLIFLIVISEIVAALETLNEFCMKTHIKLHKGVLIEESHIRVSEMPGLILAPPC